MHFEFATANRIIFGPGSSAQAGKIVAGLGKRALLVTGKGAVDIASLTGQLDAENIAWSTFSVHGEPKVEVVQQGVALARAAGSDLVIGMGGGSVLDSGKAIAGLATNPGKILDYLEVIGKGRTLTNAALPYLAIPTTAGTGSEVTRNAVLAASEQGVKVSLRSPYLLPRVALVDPDLTTSLPPDVTAATGMDALAQVIEPYVSVKANTFTDGFCQAGIQKAAWALRQAYHHGDDPDAREAMAYASLMGGLSLANAGLGAVHGFAAPIGGAFPAPHGAVCAILMAPVMRANIAALRSRDLNHPALSRYREVAAWLTGDSAAQPEDGAAWVDALCAELQIPLLRTYGITPADISSLVGKAKAASSMKANPIPLSEDELTKILEEAM